MTNYTRLDLGIIAETLRSITFAGNELDVTTYYRTAALINPYVYVVPSDLTFRTPGLGTGNSTIIGMYRRSYNYLITVVFAMSKPSTELDVNVTEIQELIVDKLQSLDLRYKFNWQEAYLTEVSVPFRDRFKVNEGFITKRFNFRILRDTTVPN